MSNIAKVCAIIVTYHPNLSTLANLLSSLQNQVPQIAIVDNTGTSMVETWLSSYSSTIPIQFFNPKNNLGLGTAHNLAMQWALVNQFEYILLFDQDSIPATTMVAELLKTHQALCMLGYQVAAVGPVYFETNTKKMSRFLLLEGWQIKKQTCQGDQWLPASFLITSGSLIATDTLVHIGMLDEQLFIDYVDIEWCFRAVSKGFQCFGVCSAHMEHSLGENVIRLLGYNFYQYSSIRKYYLLRNTWLLFKRHYFPFIWKLRQGLRIYLHLACYTLLMPNRWPALKMALLGTIHGMVGRTGKYPG
jgi:rhamnosyltransferase